MIAGTYIELTLLDVYFTPIQELLHVPMSNYYYVVRLLQVAAKV